MSGNTTYVVLFAIKPKNEYMEISEKCSVAKKASFVHHVGLCVACTYPLCQCCSGHHDNHVSANHVRCTLTFHYRPSTVWTQLVTWLLNHNLHRCTFVDVFEYIRWYKYSSLSIVSIDRLMQKQKKKMKNKIKLKIIRTSM